MSELIFWFRSQKSEVYILVYMMFTIWITNLKLSTSCTPTVSGNYELRKLVQYPTIVYVDHNLVIEYLNQHSSSDEKP